MVFEGQLATVKLLGVQSSLRSGAQTSDPDHSSKILSLGEAWSEHHACLSLKDMALASIAVKGYRSCV